MTYSTQRLILLSGETSASATGVVSAELNRVIESLLIKSVTVEDILSHAQEHGLSSVTDEAIKFRDKHGAGMRFGPPR